MLTLHKHLTSFIKPFAPARTLSLSVVRADDDELTQAIEGQYASSDYHWQLEATPDADRLDRFWTGVEDDLKHDPNWTDFSSD